MNSPLKVGGTAFDIAAGMRLQELKLRVQRADYTVDPALVAAAMLRHALSQRRCWNPRAVCATPADSSTTSGGPSRTSPIQVSGAADSAAAAVARRDAHEQLVVLAGGGAELPRGPAELPGDLRDPVGQRQRVEVDLAA